MTESKVGNLQLRMVSILSETEYATVKSVLQEYLSKEPKKFSGELDDFKDEETFPFATGLGRITIDPRFFHKDTVLREIVLGFSVSAPIDAAISATIHSPHTMITLSDGKDLLEQASSECQSILAQIGIKNVNAELWFIPNLDAKITDGESWIKNSNKEMRSLFGKDLEDLLKVSYFENGSIVCKCFHPKTEFFAVLGPSSGIEPLIQESLKLRGAIKLLSNEIDSVEKELKNTIEELSSGFRKLAEKEIDDLIEIQSRIVTLESSQLARFRSRMEVLNDTAKTLETSANNIQSKKVLNHETIDTEFAQTISTLNPTQNKISSVQEKLSSCQTLLNNIVNLSSIRSSIRLQKRSEYLTVLDVLIAGLLFAITILQLLRIFV